MRKTGKIINKAVIIRKKIIDKLPYIVSMTKIQGRYYLSEELSRLFGRQATFADQVVEKFAVAHKLQHEISIFYMRVKDTTLDDCM